MTDFEDIQHDFDFEGEVYVIYYYVEISIDDIDRTPGPAYGTVDFDTNIEVTEIGRLNEDGNVDFNVDLESPLGKRIAEAAIKQYEPDERHYDDCVEYARDNPICN